MENNATIEDARKIIEAMKIVEKFFYDRNIAAMYMGDILHIVRLQYRSLEVEQDAVTLDKICRMLKSPVWYRLPAGSPNLERCYFQYIHCHDVSHSNLASGKQRHVCACLGNNMSKFVDNNDVYVSLRNATDTDSYKGEELANVGHLLKFAERHPNFQRFMTIHSAVDEKSFTLRGASDRGMYIFSKNDWRPNSEDVILVVSRKLPENSIMIE